MKEKIIITIVILGLTFIIGCTNQSNNDVISKEDQDLLIAGEFVMNYTYNEYYGLNDNLTLFECLTDIMYDVKKDTTKFVDFDDIYIFEKGGGEYRVTINYKEGDEDVSFIFDTNNKDIYAVNNNADVILKELKEKYRFANYETTSSICEDESYKKENPKWCDGKIDSRYCFKGDSFIY